MVTCRNTKIIMNECINTANSAWKPVSSMDIFLWGKGFKSISHLTQKASITLLKLGNELITGRY